MLNLFRGRSQQHPSAKIDQGARQRPSAPRHAVSDEPVRETLPTGIPPADQVVITISSQFGSGGSEIGRLVAHDTGLLYLDHEIIGAVARRLGMNLEEATRQDEQTVGTVRHVLDALQSNGFTLNLGTLLNPMQLPAHSQEVVYWRLTRRVILEMATEGNAVIIGRGSQFLLRNSPRTLHCYIFAPLEQRIANVMEHNQLSQQEASQLVAHRDYEHEAYLRRYYGTHQDRPELYHLLINTGLFPFDLAARLIRETLPLVGAFSNSNASQQQITDEVDEAEPTETLRPIGTEESQETEES